MRLLKCSIISLHGLNLHFSTVIWDFKKFSVSQCNAAQSPAPYSRNSSYILMTNWLAAGLVLPHAAIIFFQLQEDMNKGNEERANYSEVDELPWMKMLHKLMHSNIKLMVSVILPPLRSTTLHFFFTFTYSRGTNVTKVNVQTVKNLYKVGNSSEMLASFYLVDPVSRLQQSMCLLALCV